MEEAGRAAETAWYLLPNDEEMRKNVEFFRDTREGERLAARQEAIDYVHRDNDEESLLTFIETEFTFNKSKENEKVSRTVIDANK